MKHIITVYFNLGDRVKIISEKNIKGIIEYIGFNNDEYLKNGIKGLGGIEYIVVDANGKNHVISNPSNMVELNSQELKELEADIKQYKQDNYDDDES